MDARWTTAPVPHSRFARFDRFELDLSTRHLTRDGLPLVLGRDAATLLSLLVSRAGGRVAPDEIRRHVSGGHLPGFDHRLDSWIGEIRTALGDFGASSRFLEVRPNGLRFLARVRFAAALPPAPATGNRWRAAAALAFVALGAAALSGPPSRPVIWTTEVRHAEESAARTAYLNGRYLLDRGSDDRLRESRRSFEAALASDSQYAPAYVGLAAVRLREGRTTRASLRLANEALARALRLDGTLAEAYHLLGTLRFFYYHDWDGADRAFNRALALAPDDAPALRSYAMFLAYRGRSDEALERIRQAALIDPISAEIRVDAGMIHYYARDYLAAAEECRGAVELNPAHRDSHRCLLLAYDRLGLYDQALIEAAALLSRLELPPPAHDARPGDMLDAWWRRYADSLARRAAADSGGAAAVAVAYARAGLVDSALAWIEHGAATGEPGLLSANVDPMLDSLRGLRRFRQAMAELEAPAAMALRSASAPTRNPFTHPVARQTISLRQ